MGFFKKIGLTIAYSVPCHRLPNRCLNVNGSPIPICSRCLSIYPIYLLVPFAYLLVEKDLFYLILGIGLALPMLIDGFTQKWGWRKSNHFLRITTGIMFGFSQIILISLAAKYIISTVIN